MKVLIIEDETAAAENLRAILRETEPGAEVLDTLESIDESVAWLRTRPLPDLIFMDIHLADGESFRIFDEVEVTVPVVFTTAYDRYALEAFRVSSIDYLLKPINAADVSRALAKLRRLTGSERREYGSRVRRMAAGQGAESVFLVHVRDRIIPSAASRSPIVTPPTRRLRPAPTTVRSISSTRPSKRCRGSFPTPISSAPTVSSSSPAGP